MERQAHDGRRDGGDCRYQVLGVHTLDAILSKFFVVNLGSSDGCLCLYVDSQVLNATSRGNGSLDLSSPLHFTVRMDGLAPESGRSKTIRLSESESRQASNPPVNRGGGLADEGFGLVQNPLTGSSSRPEGALPRLGEALSLIAPVVVPGGNAAHECFLFPASQRVLPFLALLWCRKDSLE